MSNHQYTIEEHVSINIAVAIDQTTYYDDSANWREGDAYEQNTCDSCIEDGYSPTDAQFARDLFIRDAIKAGVRFYTPATA